MEENGTGNQDLKESFLATSNDLKEDVIVVLDTSKDAAIESDASKEEGEKRHFLTVERIRWIRYLDRSMYELHFSNYSDVPGY
jgi:hypothetical protein